MLPSSGAGDQGLMFGYATDETKELMPLTCVLAHQLNEKLAECRRNGTMSYLRPDSKTQVTVEYKMDGGACVPFRVHTIVVSTQHAEDVSLDQIKKDVKEKVINVRIVKILSCFFRKKKRKEKQIRFWYGKLPLFNMTIAIMESKSLFFCGSFGREDCVKLSI